MFMRWGDCNRRSHTRVRVMTQIRRGHGRPKRLEDTEDVDALATMVRTMMERVDVIEKIQMNVAKRDNLYFISNF